VNFILRQRSASLCSELCTRTERRTAVLPLHDVAEAAAGPPSLRYDILLLLCYCCCAKQVWPLTGGVDQTIVWRKHTACGVVNRTAVHTDFRDLQNINAGRFFVVSVGLQNQYVCKFVGLK